MMAAETGRPPMRHTDIAIVGGGLAGSTAAAMLGRAGYGTLVIDPHEVYPADFRCEKLDESQIGILEKTGLADVLYRTATHVDELWIARFGHIVQKRSNHQYSILYAALVNMMRGEIGGSAELVPAKVAALATSPDRQTITLANGEDISARLVVLANGLNISLRHTLGIEREVVSPCHSISIGFDVKPVGRASFGFCALTYFPKRADERTAYMTMFPLGGTMRVNYFVYRDMTDPWLRQMRSAPRETLFATMPSLGKLIGDFEVVSDVKIRPVDLYVTKGHRQAGVVLVGDAFATSCPAAGTGANKVFTDVERLCNVYIPRWLATPGMSNEKVAAFYDDDVKRASDQFSEAKAYYLRSLSTDAGLAWSARRWGRFIGQLGVGALGQARERLGARTLDRQGAAAGSGARP
jgi:2-polyprenyl-6-methoxyphenol hydroxylase-like FAD-dependent oxidoreductase